MEWIHYGRYLHERLKGKPTQYITGRQEFYGREFRVTPDVLIPRPETEHVVETALERWRGRAAHSGRRYGSGAIAVTLQLETHAHGLRHRYLGGGAGGRRGECTKARCAGWHSCCCDLVSAIADAVGGPGRFESALRAAKRSAQACSARCATTSRKSRCSPARPASRFTSG